VTINVQRETPAEKADREKAQQKTEENADKRAAEEQKRQDCVSKGGSWAIGSGNFSAADSAGAGGTCTPKKEEGTSSDPLRQCGDMSLAWLVKAPFPWVKDLFVPCPDVDLSLLFKPLVDQTKTKFPFSLTNSLNNMVSYTGGSDQSAVLPTSLGPFQLDFSAYRTLILTVGLLFKGFIAWLAVNLVLSRVMGQLVIK
jgi:hypothetical protein